MDLAELWLLYADTQFRGYSPIYERVARAVAASDEVVALVQEAPPESHLPNMLLSSVHYLVLAGVDHPLAAVYNGTSEADPGPLFVDLCLQHRAEILELHRTRHINTNEVGRSAVLGPALTSVAERLGAPMGLVDVGCSAGLTMLCDTYRLSYGPAGATGPEDAAVELCCDIVGGDPPLAPHLPPIAARVGLDLDPVDITNDDDVRWQLACVWPDTDRLARTRLAFEHARHHALQIVQGDAVDSVAEVVRSLPSDCVPVVLTTWALGYLAPQRRIDFANELQQLGHERPLAWISGEQAGALAPFADVVVPTGQAGVAPSVLGLVVFSGATTDVTLLAFVHPHGTWLDWRDQPLRS